jgi:hypothetical protein
MFEAIELELLELELDFFELDFFELELELELETLFSCSWAGVTLVLLTLSFRIFSRN